MKTADVVSHFGKKANVARALKISRSSVSEWGEMVPERGAAMNQEPSEMSTGVSVSRIFEVMQAMSGQGNCITIPVPYIDFFAGDRQAHLLAAILNQLVFWSGKSHLHDGWFYKAHEELAIEVRAISEDSIRRAMDRIIKEYLPDAIEQKLRKAGGTPVKHYRIKEEIFLSKIFPQFSDSAQAPNGNGVNAESADLLDSAQTPNGNGVSTECIPRKHRMETALTPDLFSIQILKTDHYIQIIKPRTRKILLWITFLSQLLRQTFLTPPKTALWLPKTISISPCGSGRPSLGCMNALPNMTAPWQSPKNPTLWAGQTKFVCCARSMAARMGKFAA